jgi:hypothetical protein
VLAQQPDRASLNLSMMVFDRALEKKDSISLNRLMSDQITYGHSNGWIETKKDVIADLYNGTISYERIVTTQPEVTIAGNVAQVRSTADIWAKLNGENGIYKLKVLQIWLWQNGRWVLFARQSAPMAKENK